jgi:hypothetical protein
MRFQGWHHCIVYPCVVGKAVAEHVHLSQVPVSNFQAAAGFIGIKPTTSRQHMVRAILESIVFSVVQLYQSLLREVKKHYTCIKFVTMRNTCTYLCN